jgi:hypothetical protein
MGLQREISFLKMYYKEMGYVRVWIGFICLRVGSSGGLLLTR